MTKGKVDMMKVFVMVLGFVLMSFLIPAGGFSETSSTGAKTDAENKMKVKDPPVAQPVLDRRWILKMKKEKPMPPAKKTALAWKSKEQKVRCEALSKDLRETFKNARYYSIHGDACNTAAYAGLFLKATQQCTQECPEGFLEQKGYTQTIMQNVDKLLDLGNARCLEAPSKGAAIQKAPEKRP